MALPILLTFPAVAETLGVPSDSLRRAADEHGLTIRVGRTLRIMEDDIKELLELCRVNGKVPASIGEKEMIEPRSGKSGTDEPAFRPAQASASKLKSASRNTSRENIGQPVKLPRRI